VADFIDRIFTFFSRQANFQFLRVRFHSIRFREYSLLNVLKDSKKNFRQDKVWFWTKNDSGNIHAFWNIVFEVIMGRIHGHRVEAHAEGEEWLDDGGKPLVLESCAMWAWRGRLYRPSLYPMSPLLLLKGWPWRCMEKESGNRLLYQYFWRLCRSPHRRISNWLATRELISMRVTRVHPQFPFH